jgi:hypothetical protein
MTSIALYYAQGARHHTALQPTSHSDENTELWQVSSAPAAAKPAQTVRAYRRDLPGSGFVAIDVHATRSAGPRRFDGEVIVERRSARRAGHHAAPVIARATGDTIDDVVRVLFPAASCNETIAAALLRLNPVVRARSTP